MEAAFRKPLVHGGRILAFSDFMLGYRAHVRVAVEYFAHVRHFLAKRAFGPYMEAIFQHEIWECKNTASMYELLGRSR